ncbi:MAG: rhomboid family intramembrane serine protease [Bacteroidales bacterium]|nr:rhomboid family intramembrane serine protease [Bacteroidales bacterium]
MSYYEYNGYERPNFWNSLPVVTRNIIAINVLMFIATLVNQNFMIGNFAMFYPASPYFRIWQPLTHMFMHGGFWHIFFNMYTFFFFGTMLERTLGSKKFLWFYFITGFGAVALHMLVQWLQVRAGVNVAAIYQTPVLGASGAVYGVLIGYAMLFPNDRMTLLFPPVTLKAKWMMLIFAGIELVTGAVGTADGVAHFAHLGGMLFGAILIIWWRKTGRLSRW